MKEAGSHQKAQINMLPRTDNLPLREQIAAFIGGNIVPASYKRIVCGDGRYTKDQSEGGLHMFGGDMGAIAAIWKAGKALEPSRFDASDKNKIREVVQAYQKAKERILGTPEFGSVPPEIARKLYIHTDTHVHGDMLSGCGHINNMGTNKALANMYGVENYDIAEIYRFITNGDNHIDHEITTLRDDHAEQTVIYVHGPLSKQGEKPERAAYTLNSSNGSEMHFVVDHDRVMEYFDRLSTTVPLFVKGLTKEALQQAYKDQELTTAMKLAEGKQIVHVYITDRDKFDIVIDEKEKVPALPIA
ncbi:MAG: hypothetical protein KGJ07_02475 [Patescibacteria group bacterium]|nr:hypothetical protein [Patescibacteria group bacterium]MDE2589661.1 hypothetical protein [Patescibacteria group bacterium]